MDTLTSQSIALAEFCARRRSQLDLDIDAGGKMHAVEQLRVGAVDIDDALMRADLELLAAVLILVRGTEDRDDLLLRGQRDGPADLGARLLHRLHDALRRKIHQFVVVCRKFDPDLLTYHFYLVSSVFYTNFVTTVPCVSEFCGKEKDGFVLVIERYSLPTAEYPEGRLLIVAADKVLYDGVLPYETESGGRRGFPFVRQVSIPAPASFFGGSLVERMIPIQKAYNAVKNRKHEFFNRLTAGVLLAEDGSVDVDDLDEEGIAPGKVIIYRQGCEKPEMVNFGSVPQEFGEEEDRLLKEFVTVSGVNDFLVTGAFTGLNYSGAALNIIMEQSNARLCVTTESIRTAERAVAAKILRIYKQFATDERLAAVENSSYGESAAFRASDISADDIVFNLDDGQINSLTDRRGLAKEICEMNLLADKDGNISDESKRKLLELLGCEGFATTRNTDELHRGRAAKENESVGKERLKTDNLDDHEIHIAEHTAYLLSAASGIGETEKQILGNHIAEHRAMIAGNNA